MKVKTKEQYYDPEPLFADECMLNIIMGSRDTGKSYTITKKAMELVVESDYKRAIAYNRRYSDMVTKSQVQLAFNSLIENGEIEKVTNGEYTTLYYNRPVLRFANVDDSGNIDKKGPVCAYAISLEDASKIKNTNMVNADIFLFEEFMPQVNESHLFNEVKSWDSVLGTLLRGDVPDTFKAYFIGNTTKPISPYFEHFKLKRILDMKPGDIDYYKFHHPLKPELFLSVRVEYTLTYNQLNNTVRKKDVWFMFSDSSTMITDGGWDIPVYPVFPEDIEPKEQITFYLIESKQIIKATLYATNTMMFIHHKMLSPEFKIPVSAIKFSLDFSLMNNCFVSPMQPIPQLKDKQYIAHCYSQSRCSFDSSITAAHVIEYLKISKGRNLLLS